MAMAPHGKIAGSASALLGTTQFFFAAIAGALVGKLHNGTPVPMAGIVAFCGVSALVIFRGAHARTP
jgi:DHA1 family bicyclomycin/chloramphenicol resistance-like MFS transporter